MNKVVADLINVIKSPVLLNSEILAKEGEFISDEWCARELLSCSAELRELSHEPSDLILYLEKNLKNHRLGYYFEALFGYWFRNVRKFERVYGNLPVRGPQATLGEFDLVIGEDKNPVGTHFELAVKFYLCHVTPENSTVTLASYLGPNARDRLDRKVHRLLNRQMKLPLTAEGRQTLQMQGFDRVHSKALVKGALFYPLNSPWKTHEAPREVSPFHERGWWCSLSNFRDLENQDHSNLRWVVLSRNEWVTPALENYIHADRFLTKRQLLDLLSSHFSEGKQSVMVAEFKCHESKRLDYQSKGFIVDDLWPQISSESYV